MSTRTMQFLRLHAQKLCAARAASSALATGTHDKRRGRGQSNRPAQAYVRCTLASPSRRSRRRHANTSRPPRRRVWPADRAPAYGNDRPQRPVDPAGTRRWQPARKLSTHRHDAARSRVVPCQDSSNPFVRRFAAGRPCPAVRGKIPKASRQDVPPCRSPIAPIRTPPRATRSRPLRRRRRQKPIRRTTATATAAAAPKMRHRPPAPGTRAPTK